MRAQAAAMNWVIKDGLGQAGGIVFAAWLGRRKGMDADPKKWRSVSALAMDAATLMEILSPLVPGFFLAVASVANVGKNIACVRVGVCMRVATPTVISSSPSLNLSGGAVGISPG